MTCAEAIQERHRRERIEADLAAIKRLVEEDITALDKIARIKTLLALAAQPRKG